MRLERTVPADQPSRGKIRVSNPSDRATRVRIQTGPYRAWQPEVSLPSAQDWFSFEPAQFSLPPGGSLEVAYTVEPPAQVAQASHAEYLAALLIDELPSAGGTPGARSWKLEAGKEKESSITVVPRLAIPVYLLLEGRQRRQVELSGLTLETGPQTSGVPAPPLLRAQTLLRNLGTVHVRPSGSLAIFKSDGTLVRAAPLGKSVPLLPTATLRIPVLLPMPPPGSYKAVVTVEVQGEEFLQREATFAVTAQGRILQPPGE